jgi:hypothetical protein
MTFNASAAIAAYLFSNKGRVKSRESPDLARLPYEYSPKMTYLDSYFSARHARQQPFDEYRRLSIDLGFDPTHHCGEGLI